MHVTTWGSALTVFLFAAWTVGEEASPDAPIASTASTFDTSFEYCIIGAGPGGLQLAHLLQQRGRNYVLIDKASAGGSFYRDFPRHRKLISINKRHTGRSDEEFNLRHDWNSLLENDEAVPRITTRTVDRFPGADVLRQYLEEYGATIPAALWNTAVEKVHKEGDGHFILAATDVLSGRAKNITCSRVVVATGLSEPNQPVGKPWSRDELDLMTGYEELPEDSSVFENKTVAVLGFGNAAGETAEALAPHVAYVHVFLARPPKQGHDGLRLSWETRYVGDLRAVNAGILDSCK